jgi:hypothetical protein
LVRIYATQHCNSHPLNARLADGTREGARPMDGSPGAKQKPIKPVPIVFLSITLSSAVLFALTAVVTMILR